jgi:hypothetical protein
MYVFDEQKITSFVGIVAVYTVGTFYYIREILQNQQKIFRRMFIKNMPIVNMLQCFGADINASVRASFPSAHDFS